MSIHGFLPCVWPPEMPFSAAEGEKKNTKKKKVGKSIGDPVRGRDAPIMQSTIAIFRKMLSMGFSTTPMEL